MEHWLTEESTIRAMVDLSLCDEEFSTEALETAFRVRMRTKLLKLAETAFRSSLEVSLFSDFDFKGGDTVLDLQSRLAKKFIPHADLESNNLEPLISVLKGSIDRRHTDQYRYLWGDCASASFFKSLKGAYENNESAVDEFRDLLRRVVLNPGAAANYRDLLQTHKTKYASIVSDLLELYKIQ